MLCFMYKIHNNILPSYFQNLFTTNLNIYDHFTRQASKFPLHPTIEMSEQIVFRFMVLNFGTVYPQTLQFQHLSQYLKNDVLRLCINTLKFEFIFSYYCNLCFLSFSSILFSIFVMFFSVSIIFLLHIRTINIYIYIH